MFIDYKSKVMCNLVYTNKFNCDIIKHISYEYGGLYEIIENVRKLTLPSVFVQAHNDINVFSIQSSKLTRRGGSIIDLVTNSYCFLFMLNNLLISEQSLVSI